MRIDTPKMKSLQAFIFRIAVCLELLMAFVVIVSVLVVLVSVPTEIRNLYYHGHYNTFLQTIFDIIIGIELLKMLCRHDLDSVVEVLLFAVAREMVIAHMATWETLIGVLAIGILFMIRKYLFIPVLDKDNPSEKGGRTNS